MFVYIIYSESIDKFYVGYTIDLVKRILEHNSGFYKDSFTKRAKDWELFYYIKCKSKAQAIKVEQHIKRMKSRSYLQNIKKYVAISERLLVKY